MSIPWTRIAIYGVLVSFAILYLMPIYVLVVTGLKSFNEVSLSQMWDLPSGLHFDPFRDAFKALDANLANSFRMVIPATVFSCMLGSINGYVLTKWRFPGSAKIGVYYISGIGRYAHSLNSLTALIYLTASKDSPPEHESGSQK